MKLPGGPRPYPLAHELPALLLVNRTGGFSGIKSVSYSYSTDPRKIRDPDDSTTANEGLTKEDPTCFFIASPWLYPFSRTFPQFLGMHCEGF